MVTLPCHAIASPVTSAVRKAEEVSGFPIRRPRPATSAHHFLLKRPPSGKSRMCLSRRHLFVHAGIDGPRGPDKGGKEPQVDWDSAWTTFRGEKKKKKMNGNNNILGFMDDYVSRTPPQSPKFRGGDTDPLRRTENLALDFWTNPKFTYAGIGVLVSLFVYMVVIIGPPPSR